MINLKDNAQKIYPDVFSFISFRRENNGGFIFNPHLYNERWVDNIGLSILELLDGTHSVSKIVETISETWSIEHSESERIVLNHLQDLGNYYAIKWRKEEDKKQFSERKNLFNKKMCREEHKKNYYSAPLSVLWDLTYRCNLRCRHCLIGDSSSNATKNELDLNEIEKVLNELREMNVFRINFSGGEPLLRRDLFEILGMTTKYNFGVTLSTNGYFLDRDFVERLNDLDVFSFQISLDGIGKTHDEFRGIKGAYNKAVDALYLLSERGYYTIMSTMITKNNMYEIENLIDLAVKIGISSFKLNSFMPVGRGNKNKGQLTVPKENMRKLAKLIVKKKKEYENRIDLQLGALCPWLLGPEPLASNVRGVKNPYQLKCSAGQNTLVIAPDGTIFPCPYLTDFNLGNILNEPLRKIWNNNDGILGKFRNLYQEDLKGKCRSCQYVFTECNGGCRAAAHIINNDFHGEDPFCWKTQT